MKQTYLNATLLKISRETAAGDDLGNLKLLRIVRLLRLIKLLRIVRSARIFKRIEESGSISFSSMGLIKLLLVFLMVLHWLACLWNLGPQFESEYPTWWDVDHLGFDLPKPRGWSPWAKWVACMEFSLQAMVMGYGSITPVTDFERALAVIILFMGGSTYAILIGSICELLSNTDPASTEFKQNMDMLNKYMDEIGLEIGLKTRLRQCVIEREDG